MACWASWSIAAIPDVPQDPQAKSGYVNEEYAIKLIEAQGFRLVAKSEINANPKDTKDYEQGVWTLPPTYRLGRQGSRQVRRDRRERPLHAEVREARQAAMTRARRPKRSRSPHLFQARADVERRLRRVLQRAFARRSSPGRRATRSTSAPSP